MTGEVMDFCSTDAGKRKRKEIESLFLRNMLLLGRIENSKTGGKRFLCGWKCKKEISLSEHDNSTQTANISVTEEATASTTSFYIIYFFFFEFSRKICCVGVDCGRKNFIGNFSCGNSKELFRKFLEAEAETAKVGEVKISDKQQPR